MASPPVPPALENLTTRPFSFYPAIVGIEHNEWLFRKATWSEFLVVNCRSGAEIWISRRYLGEVARIEDPVVIVGLNRELEMKGSMIVPFQRRIIEMPVAVGGPQPVGSPADTPAPARIVGIRLEASDRGVVKLLGIAVAVIVGIVVIGFGYMKVGDIRQKRIEWKGSDQSFASLNSHDDFLAVKQKVGQPGGDREQEMGTIMFRALDYPERKYTIILMGRDKNSMAYIGTMDQDWHPIAAANVQDDSLLHNLKRF